jgi:hypothetical protein
MGTAPAAALRIGVGEGDAAPSVSGPVRNQLE